MEPIELGRVYVDRVSGWSGTAVARYEYLNGCVRYELGGADKDGKPESFVFDWQQLDPVNAPPVVVESARTGGPRGNTPIPR